MRSFEMCHFTTVDSSQTRNEFARRGRRAIHTSEIWKLTYIIEGIPYCGRPRFSERRSTFNVWRRGRMEMSTAEEKLARLSQFNNKVSRSDSKLAEETADLREEVLESVPSPETI